MSHSHHEDWNPRDERVLENQTAAFDEQRRECPVAYSEFLGWSLFRHQDVVNAVDDPESFSSQSRHIQIPNGMDPPEHSRYREIIEQFFSPQWLNDQEPRSRELASNLLDSLTGITKIDFMESFVHPYALQSLCDFIGWPRETWEFLRGWTHGNQRAALARNRDVSAALAHDYSSYVQEGIDTRREADTDDDFIERNVKSRRTSSSSDGEDIISQLMRLELDGERLTDEQIINITRNWTAGHGTVAAALGIIVHALAQDSDLQQRLRDDPRLISAAIEEIPRTNGPLVANRRTTTREVEIGGRTIPEGAKTSLMWIAANRDPDAFENPQTIDLDRDPSHNLLYGHGIHYCIGAELSRLELRVAIEELLNRTEEISLNPEGPRNLMVYPSNGFQELSMDLR